MTTSEPRMRLWVPLVVTGIAIANTSIAFRSEGWIWYAFTGAFWVYCGIVWVLYRRQRA